ncbi:PDDEXK nuclease domain-containing protein [Candidatus Nitrotoga arctica]|uniref:YhcG PDDEXK nuclease domain-containing protein n=1 Tax=Candidatus Nitrotoga arctica TaxID=453162 RepID=A0ABN8ASG2_9PROT|nr:PDDEXK nuclease domain-containing protein [Candidatus Nitrotoga arctica]CAG9933566.1 protein of unknown function [Candidatus Nitrotoga arctica]
MSFDQLLLSGKSQMLEFKTRFETSRLLEADLEQAIINELQSFLLKLGMGAYVARQMRIATKTQDFYVDLVRYIDLLNCFAPLNLKVGEALPFEDELQRERGREGCGWQNKKK